ncbi:uncharacterized protein LOC107796432 isoform X2 [Nicotiana tabacum]|uniref:Tobamovirus multiplication protein 2B isoform X1 n=2 Tax=Nicotiana TaxID=4085 RepID=A0A1S4ADI2_TOBAC|nr:PREDICTED: tobamovirus multiplication protein 2B isoform X1 [Nicotiana sylvestris]XP_016474679.1 PREDICTED: tobamovirus multiplication protein 2B-like isoform X1 [Nicotiana tabacum]
MATSTSTGKTGGSSSSRDGSAKTMVADQITQSIQSTSNLLHLMLQSSPSQAELMKLPKTLFAKTPTIKNTELVLEQLPQVISALDAHMENGLQRFRYRTLLIRVGLLPSVHQETQGRSAGVRRPWSPLPCILSSMFSCISRTYVFPLNHYL